MTNIDAANESQVGRFTESRLGRPLYLPHGPLVYSGHGVPSDYLMSRRHFSIECESGVAILKDEQSTNGTFLNGERVHAASLADRDRISAGMTMFFVQLII